MIVHPHGSRERYEAGCECDGCRLMMILHTKHDPVTADGETKRSADPYATVLRALLRRGYHLRDLAEITGFETLTLRNIALGITAWIYPGTAAAIEGLIPLLPSEGARDVG
jgi:hypothetical protein